MWCVSSLKAGNPVQLPQHVGARAMLAVQVHLAQPLHVNQAVVTGVSRQDPDMACKHTAQPCCLMNQHRVKRSVHPRAHSRGFQIQNTHRVARAVTSAPMPCTHTPSAHSPVVAAGCCCCLHHCCCVWLVLLASLPCLHHSWASQRCLHHL